MSMTPDQAKLIEERRRVDVARIDLSEFVRGKEFAKVDSDERALIYSHSESLLAYSRALNARIDYFGR